MVGCYCDRGWHKKESETEAGLGWGAWYLGYEKVLF